MADATLVEAQGTEARKAKLLKDGWTPQATYDTALRNLRSAEARLASAKANLNLTHDQLRYTELKADFDGVITAVGAEAGQNVNAGQMVVQARPARRQGCRLQHCRDRFHRSACRPGSMRKSSSGRCPTRSFRSSGVAREISPVADPTTRTYTVKVTLKNPPPQLRFGMSIAGRWKAQTRGPVVALPLSALFEQNGTPAVWVVDQRSGSVALRLSYRRSLRDRRRHHR